VLLKRELREREREPGGRGGGGGAGAECSREGEEICFVGGSEIETRDCFIVCVVASKSEQELD